MKHTILFIFSFISFAASAQIVQMPDTNFKAALLSANTANSIALDGSNNPIVVDVNSDSEIQESEAAAVIALNISNSGIVTLEGIDSFVNLEVLNCEGNLLTVLNVSGLAELKNLNCSNNNLEALGLNNNTNLEYLDFSVNNITELFIKNGKNEFITQESWNTNIDLAFICADEFQVEDIMTEGGNMLNVNTYCSFIPGGNYNSIEGVVKFDVDADGCNDDAGQSFVKMNVSDGIDTQSVFTNAAGEYAFYTQTGSYTISPEFENNYYNVSPPTAFETFPVVDNSVAIHDFCVTANGNSKDVEVVMVPIVPAQPGEDAMYKIVYKNKGNQVVSGSVNCLWNYNKFGNVVLVPTPNVQDLGDYTWYYTNLLPFESREVVMTLEVNPSSGLNPVYAGDVLDFIATATLSGTDALPQDNNFVLNQPVVDSFTSNNIICIQGDTVPVEEIDQYLHYVVNFENTGNAIANSVVISHYINPDDFDIASLQVLNSSHGMTARIKENVIEFIFDNISLGVMDHGNILFKLKPKSGLMQGDTVANQANVYFDYQAPVMTNEAVTVFGTLNNRDFAKDISINMYPNPSGNVVNIKADSNIQSLEMYDIQGRLLQALMLNTTEATIDISKRASGIYFMKVKTEQGIKVEKLVRQ